MYIRVKWIIEKKKKKRRAGTWFYVSVVDWIEAYLIVSLQSIVRNGQGLSGLNVWSDMCHKISVISTLSYDID